MQPHYLLPFLFTLALTLDPCQMHIAHLLQLYTLDRPQCITFFTKSSQRSSRICAFFWQNGQRFRSPRFLYQKR